MSLTLVLILFTAYLSWQAFENRDLFNRLKHQPYLVTHHKEYYRLLTSGFVHASWLHLGINMYVFWIFGEMVENRFVQEFGLLQGRLLFVLVYLITIIAANLPTNFKHSNNPVYGSVGASGTISGMVFIFILFYPWSTLLLFFIIPMPAIVAGVIFLIYSSYASKQALDNIDHDAHFFGAISGLIFTLLLKPSLFFSFLTNFAAGLPF